MTASAPKPSTEAGRPRRRSAPRARYAAPRAHRARMRGSARSRLRDVRSSRRSVLLRSPASRQESVRTRHDLRAICASGCGRAVGRRRNSGDRSARESFSNSVRAGFRARIVIGSVSAYGGDGGPATEAYLHTPNDVAVDPRGGVYIADKGNHTVRYVDPAGTIRTVASTGTAGFGGDGGPAAQAQLSVARNQQNRHALPGPHRAGRRGADSWTARR